MKTNKCRIALLGGLLFLMAILAGGEALAHTFRGTLGGAPDAEAKFMLNCYPTGGYVTERFVFMVSGLTRNRPYTLQLTVSKGAESAIATDPANGDRKPGLANDLAEGDGSYFLTVRKVAAGGRPAKGAMVFEVENHCDAGKSGNYYHTGTTEPVRLIPNASGFNVFTGAIKAKPDASKAYLVVCYPESGRATGRYGFRVRAESKKRPFGVKLTVTKEDGLEETVDFAANDGEFSEWGYLEQGDGPYRLVLSKEAEAGDTKGAIGFKVESQCESEEEGLNSGITVPIRQ